MTPPRPLPAYGRAIVAMLQRGERPAILGGALVAALDWDIAPHWPRIVVPDDPAGYRFDFARGVDWLVVGRAEHQHLHDVARALREAGAHVVAPVTLPEYDA
jgi:hypothetical protein